MVAESFIRLETTVSFNRLSVALRARSASERDPAAGAALVPFASIRTRRGARGSLACDLVTPLRSALVDALLLGKLGKQSNPEKPIN